MSLRKTLPCIVLAFYLLSGISAQEMDGYFNMNWVDTSGQLLLEIPEDRIGESFLYANSLTTGVGSNDIGLDRGQLGGEQVVHFYKSGKKILLVAENLKYRAISDNPDEVNSVKEAFAHSVIWGFEIAEKKKNSYLISLNDFLLRDAHGVTKRLEDRKQGSYKIDKSKSAVYKEGVLNFPMNTEMEALLTFCGDPKGDYIRSVAAIAENVSVRQHHSFIALPDSDYQPRMFHTESGYIYTSYFDYSSPIGDDMQVRHIIRHRLEKKNPGVAASEAKEPIIYYLDRGCPEPVKSALLEGGAWWNEAFEEAGFKNAFQIKILPEDAHPLDVRYNVIQWVHRSTRGWSYGASVVDPRTGEILKGHVSLGSLRVRQDYMIAQGILAGIEDESRDSIMLTMALDRLKQLSAHEIGHTIGLAHNFAASYNDRASVMDYPHPHITKKNGKLDFANAYDKGIGEWDKRTITYGYSEVPDDTSEKEYLHSLIQKNRDDGYLFITDQDSRSTGSFHPYSHLWDNGEDVVVELNRLMELRSDVLKDLNVNVLKENTPNSELEKILVPAYLMHRYQAEAVAKLVGGVDFSYDTNSKSIEEKEYAPLDESIQLEALQALLKIATPEYLKIPASILESIPPPAYGYNRTRENFKGYLGSQLDPLAIAEASTNHILDLLLNPERLARIDVNNEGQLNLANYFDQLNKQLFKAQSTDQIQQVINKSLTIHMIALAENKNAAKSVRGAALLYLDKMKSELPAKMTNEHNAFLLHIIDQFKNAPETFELPSLQKMPPGSPIGCYD